LAAMHIVKATKGEEIAVPILKLKITKYSQTKLFIK
jgi:hypothetical protein